MNSLIALVLILDFSGSMEQKLLDKTKRQILENSVVALSTTLKKNQNVLVLSYGAGKRTDCKTVDRSVFKPEALAAWTQVQRPKKFAVTPLARAIRLLKNDLHKSKIRRVLIITDGNDTCGEDVCKALWELDADLERSKAKIQLDLLGYDLNASEQQKLSCDKIKGSAEKMTNVGFTLHTANNDVQFEKKLETIEEEAKKKTPLNGKSTIQMTGAPSTMTFQAKVSEGEEVGKTVDWKGPFPMEVPPNVYQVKAQGTGSPPVQVKVAGDERKEVPFFHEFKNLGPGELNLQGLPVGFEFTPMDGQNSGKPVQIRAPGNTVLPPGRWKLKTVYPKWLNGVLAADVMIEPGSKKDLSVDKILEGKVKWVRNKGNNAAAITFADAVKKWNVLILPHSDAVPVPQGLKYEWVED